MANLKFSLVDYQKGLAHKLYVPPNVFCPYYDVDPVLYNAHGSTDQRRNKLHLSIDELRKRTGTEYFNKIYPLQARTLDYSARSFPAYRFILPEVMTEDWLAIMDWGKFQRDHVLHQPLCGYVVLKLLDEKPGKSLQTAEGQTLLDGCVKRILQWKDTSYIKDFLISCGMDKNDPILHSDSPIAEKVWRSFFREAAYVAAIFHDLGYPWQYAERMQGNLDGMNTPAIRHNRSADQIVEQYGHRLLFHAINGYQSPDKACPSTWKNKITKLVDEALSKTHGLPGALGFLHLNDCVRRYPNTQSAMHLLCIEWVAMAIMMHDMGKIYWGKSKTGTPENPFLRLSFDRDPLSAIVTLADVIQEFERPAVRFGSKKCNGKEFVTLNYDKACSATQLISKGSNIELHYMMESNEMRALKKKSLPDEIYNNFDPQYGYVDMSSIGFSNVKLFAS